MSSLLGDSAFVHEARVEGDSIRLYVEDGTQVMPKVFDLLEARNVAIERVSLAQPSLDDVFLTQTGRTLRDAQANDGPSA